MVDDVMAQMGFGVADAGAEDRMRGVAKQLRGDRSLGQLFQFSGSQAVRDAGGGMVSTAQKGITDIGTRRAQGLTRSAQAARDKESMRVNAAAEERAARLDERQLGQDEYKQQQDAQRMATGMQALETSERERAEDDRRAREDAKLAYTRKKELQELGDVAAGDRARSKADAVLGAANKMGATEKKNYRLARNAVTEMPNILSMVEATPSAFGAGKDLVAYGPDWLPNMATEGIKVAQNKALTDDEQQARNAVYNKAYRIINSLAGAALSKHEKDRIDQFTPTTNDDARTVRNKLIQMQEFVDEKYSSFDMYSDFQPIEKPAVAEEVVAETTDEAVMSAEAIATEREALLAELMALDAKEKPQGLAQTMKYMEISP